MRNNISSEIIGVLKRMFGESWGPRMEYILRYTILALLEYPDTTMLDITRMLTNKEFRNQVLAKVTDTVVLQFWRVEFASWSEKYATEAIAPVLNKVGAFVANPTIRNIIGQPKSSFNIRQIMDEGKILVVNLSKGLIGEDNAAILGSFLVTKIQLAAMSRSDIPNVEDRRPFYLYVDEFQNFATDSFAVILSEARKYGLNLTVANQYISQMSDNVRDAVFGNVGTMMSMRVSPEDAPILAQQFAPQFEAQDILQMNNRHFVCTMMINGEKTPAFSGTTLRLPEANHDYLDEIIVNTRAKYARPRAEIEAEIATAIQPPIQLQSKTAREKAKKAAKEGGSNKPTISPSGVSGSQKLGDLMAQIRSAAEAGDPNSMKIEGTRSKINKQNPVAATDDAAAAQQSANQLTAKPTPATTSVAQTTKMNTHDQHNATAKKFIGGAAASNVLPAFQPIAEQPITTKTVVHELRPAAVPPVVQPLQAVTFNDQVNNYGDGLKIDHQPVNGSEQDNNKRRRRSRSKTRVTTSDNAVVSSGEIRLH